MPRPGGPDFRPDYALLVRALQTPEIVPSLPAVELGRLIDAANAARLRGWLISELDRRELPRNAPDWLHDRILTVRAFVGEHERAVRWEIDRLQLALSGMTWVLLKGAAYVAAGLPPGRGRQVADVDVLVAESDLAEAERRLNVHGWRIGELDAYDERYYRHWMHELPPLVHDQRRSVVDVHHAILPRTSRLQPLTSRLLEQSRVCGDVRVLSPSHMVLHAAAHLFHDGEISGAIRDVVDLDGLFRTFGSREDFWKDFVDESVALGLTRPASYAMRYAARLMKTPIPPPVIQITDQWAPAGPTRFLMDALVERALPGTPLRTSHAATFALYVRSHWLRMPPLMLARHLLRKSVRREPSTRAADKRLPGR